MQPSASYLPSFSQLKQKKKEYLKGGELSLNYEHTCEPSFHFDL
ncbi:hypothetical protein GAGA_0058 [Paraglaciecola agarilytica NO2]|uniref:Uncharacterized protein n=1 Tax=Paraglaciecola agarilytica NO2 TaxID=1125747 RepID=A0ABQ0I0S9_9ALTE|nr:hypothetical protein GAGA_0058 [Paraglaciecola agarilytica NO2]